MNSEGGSTSIGSVAMTWPPRENSAIGSCDRASVTVLEIGCPAIAGVAVTVGVTIGVGLAAGAAEGVAIGEAVEAIRRVEAEVKMPPSINTNFTGSAQLFQDAQKGQVPLILAAVLTIYIVLGVLYESYIHPLTILSGLPSAGIGALLALKWYGMDLSVIALIGILLLVGIVKKNAIMMIDFAIEAERAGGRAPFDAMYEACIVRFRPIMMTTMAALVGTLPIALGLGAGAEARRPLGLAVVGGLIVSQTLTLYITPVLYCYLDALGERFRGRRRAVPVSAE